jgi:hypothetical protein
LKQHVFLTHPSRPRRGGGGNSGGHSFAVLATMDEVIAIHDPGTPSKLVPTAAVKDRKSAGRDHTSRTATATVDACVSGMQLVQALKKPRLGEDQPQ